MIIRTTINNLAKEFVETIEKQLEMRTYISRGHSHGNHYENSQYRVVTPYSPAHLIFVTAVWRWCSGF